MDETRFNVTSNHQVLLTVSFNYEFHLQDEEDIYGEEARGENDADEDDEDEGEDAGISATLRANVRKKICGLYVVANI
jgi:hypothetical protein